jgi:hypothetical protein
MEKINESKYINSQCDNCKEIFLNNYSNLKNNKNKIDLNICKECFNRQMNNLEKCISKNFSVEINKITNKIYLGNYKGAKEIERLNFLGVKDLLACGIFLLLDVDKDTDMHKSFNILELKMTDSIEEDLFSFLKKGILFIEQSKCIYIFVEQVYLEVQVF